MRDLFGTEVTMTDATPCRICGSGDFLATIYHHLGIDSATTLIRDFNGRPTPIVDHGKPISELLG